MSAESVFPWNRYALMAEVAARYGQSGRQLRKTSLMKMIYLLEELHDVDVGYRFGIYTYGPFDAQVLEDLDVLGSMDVLEVKRDPDGWGYQIQASGEADGVKANAADFLAEHSERVDALFEEFGDKSAVDLELESTIVFVHKRAVEKDQDPTPDSVAKIVNGLKPKFTRSHIKKTYERLLARVLA